MMGTRIENVPELMGETLRVLGWAILAVALVTGCGRKPAGAPAFPPPQVGVITVQPRPMPVTTELPGRIDPVRSAAVLARADGIVLRQEFEQGADVTNGQVLYQIDPAPYKAALDSAQAALTQAQLLEQRDQPLLGINAVSKQNFDNAVSAAKQARAARDIAAINLGYCTVTAPISGRVGAALVTEGALVSQSTATQMALIQQLDPIYFDFTQSSTEALKLRQQLQAGQVQSLSADEAEVKLVLPDGSVYLHPGKLLFADVTVDPSSGMITLRALFPNPEGLLLPGMFAVGRLNEALAPQALLVPQPAVVIAPDGSASVLIVTPDNKAQSQPVQLGPAVGTGWEIESGLKAGDRVIVEGLLKAYPGMTVLPVPSDITVKEHL